MACAILVHLVGMATRSLIHFRYTQVCQTPRSSRARAMQAFDAEFVGEMCGTALAEPRHQVHLHLRPTQEEAQRDNLEIQVLLVCVCVVCI